MFLGIIFNGLYYKFFRVVTKTFQKAIAKM